MLTNKRVSFHDAYSIDERCVRLFDTLVGAISPKARALPPKKSMRDAHALGAVNPQQLPMVAHVLRRQQIADAPIADLAVAEAMADPAG